MYKKMCSYARSLLFLAYFYKIYCIIMHFSINEEVSIFSWCSDSASPGMGLQDFSLNQRFHNTVLQKASCTRATG